MNLLPQKLSDGFTSLKTPVLVLLIALGAIFFVWQRAYTLSLSRRVASLENRHSELRAQNSQKIIQISRLNSPDRIEALAKDMCGLRYSHPEERILVVQKTNSPLPQSRLKQSFFAIKDYFAQKWASFTGSRKQHWMNEHGNL